MNLMNTILNKTIKSCLDSLECTMEIVSAGIKESNEYLTQEKAEREAYYLSLIF